MATLSAGILLYRLPDGPPKVPAQPSGGPGGRTPGEPDVLLGHMGGPFWQRRDEGAWSIPKGEYTGDETPEAAARREFTEELGLPVPPGELQPLGEVKQSGGKVVTAWALHGDVDLAGFTPGTFELEWPRGSGRVREFPEVDRVEWFDLTTARAKVVKAQREFLDRLAALLDA